MKLFLLFTFLLLALAQLQPCDGSDTKTAPTATSKRAIPIPPLPQVSYPRKAQWAHIKGAGMYGIEVDPSNGHVIRTFVVKSSGSEILDDAALKAYRKFRFKPGGPSHVEVPCEWQ